MRNHIFQFKNKLRQTMTANLSFPDLCFFRFFEEKWNQS